MVLSIYLLSPVEHFALVKIRVLRDEDSVTRLHFALVKSFLRPANHDDISWTFFGQFSIVTRAF